jgi:hypothetical protein
MIPGIVDSAVSAARAFTDEFSGTGSLAQRWTSTRGSWSVVEGKSSTATAASSYPLASFNSNTPAVNVRVDYGAADTHGWGVAFWVKDTANWWAVVTDKTFGYVCDPGDTLTGTTCKKPDTTTTTTGLSCTYSCPGGLILSGTGCYGYYACGPFSYYTDTLCFTFIDGAIWGGCLYDIPGAGMGLTYGCSSPSLSYVGSADAACTPYTIYNTVTGASYTATTQYTYKIRLIKSVAGTVTEVATKNIQTTTTSNSTIEYVQASVSKAGVITATAKMNGGTTIETLTNTPSSPITAKRHGFILAPTTTGTQANSMERFIYSPA